MSDQHTQGKLISGVSIFRGREAFTAVPADATGKIVALFGFCGANDEAESIANLRRFVACWNMLASETTEDIESNPLPAMFDQLSTHMEQLEKNCDVILAKCYTLANALQKAATAMETISMSAGKDPYMQTFELVRDYAKKAAVSAGKAAEGGAA